MILIRTRASLSLARALLWFTLAWNVAEGVIAVSSGLVASSVALVGFGLDSFIEVTAAAILIWRLSLAEGDERSERREQMAHRIVGATFIALAVYILAQSAYVFADGRQPEESGVGMALAVAATIVMPALALAKRRNAAGLGSRALIAEARETFACSYLSLTLFVGLAANALAGWWWADVAAALAMVPWIAREGVEGLRAEGCED